MKYTVELLNTIKTNREIIDVLINDINKIFTIFQEEPIDFRLRLYIRSYFALVEGMTYKLKQIALAVHKENPCFTDAEVSLLNEVAYELNEKGNAQEKVKHLDTLANIKFSFNSVLKAFGTTANINYGDHGWYSFKQLLKIRNQITHPKNIALFRLIEDDTDKSNIKELIIEATQWYTNQISYIFTEMECVVQQHIK